MHSSCRHRQGDDAHGPGGGYRLLRLAQHQRRKAHPLRHGLREGRRAGGAAGRRERHALPAHRDGSQEPERALYAVYREESEGDRERGREGRTEGLGREDDRGGQVDPLDPASAGDTGREEPAGGGQRLGQQPLAHALTTSTRLPVELEAQLQIAHRGPGAADGSEGARADGESGGAEAGVVQTVEGFGAELEAPAAVAEVDVLEESEVDVIGAGDLDDAGAAVAEGTEGLAHDGGGVEPAAERALAGVEIGVGDTVRNVAIDAADVGADVAGGGEVFAFEEDADDRDGPAADELVGDRPEGIGIRLAFAEGQFVVGAESEPLRLAVGRGAIVSLAGDILVADGGLVAAFADAERLGVGIGREKVPTGRQALFAGDLERVVVRVVNGLGDADVAGAGKGTPALNGGGSGGIRVERCLIDQRTADQLMRRRANVGGL